MSIAALETILADVESSLWKKRCESLEALLDAVDAQSGSAADEDTRPAYAGLTQRYSENSGGMGNGAPEAYRGRSIEREGDTMNDNGSINSVQASRMETLRGALQDGGPGNMPPQTTKGRADLAAQYSRKDRNNMGDVDNSGALSGAGPSKQNGY